MLQVKNRLTKKRDFEIAFENGATYRGHFVLAKIWRIDPTKFSKRGYAEDDLKFGFVAGLKVSKKAVERNRIKRQLREIIRLLIKDKKITPGYFVIFIANNLAVDEDYSRLSGDILQILQKSRLIT